MTLLHSPRRRFVGAAAGVFGLLATLFVASPAVATPGTEEPPTVREIPGHESADTDDPAMGTASTDIPGVDEIVHSRNISHLATVPGEVLRGTTSDIAFRDHYAFVGNYDGFTVYDIRRPERPRIITEVFCPGAQNDISVYGDLLILSVDSSRSDDSCNSTTMPATRPEAWEGIRVFDISDLRAPKYVAAVETACGSHTHTLVPGKGAVYVYVSSYFPHASYPDCQPPHDGISIVKVPLKTPRNAELVSFEVLFPDGGFPGDATGTATSGCHDITAYPALRLAAGACLGDGILMDITDPEAPRVIDRVQDAEHFAFWHSATFSQDGSKVVFTDELGGGGAATCTAAIGPEYGANGIYHITGKGDRRKLEFRSYYKIPRHQADTENCVAHNGSLIPAKGRDIMVQSWYQGGVSVWEFTDSDNPVEIGWFDRGPVSEERLTFGGTWSAYYYNGHIYSSEQRGLDVLRITDPRTNSARSVKLSELNVQTQPRYR
ncbi:hypothetical protein FNQ90_10475 [Streptomyces alkaliphilus]|uniref:LVIVD repeat-containing protein n=1 Tax=Streptomyces alkaliphilus TaxID=1472722 RepID=A0A7W3TCW0_9ACTN|nr:hypothetical protein [Streptomyces alkaliphilus]MBB0244518.1 hypothetical protein [Streptomyces alkaliphilus]